MSASDQDTQAAEDPKAARAPEADEPAPKTPEEPEGPQGTEEDEETEEEDVEEGPVAAGLTPKQARRLRVAAASFLLVAMAVVLVIRLASRTSVLVVGVYGLAMILCGVVIELSRNGRTRLGTWLLVVGLLGALALDWLVLP
ncbi:MULTISPECIES: hypothetical protein [unclassified Streptomyces]|uniref:hypothetical protein n=1 Tax=unclassified Streptomyces TaxID=2593676 RepID=UPI001660CB8F|nr:MULTISPECIES: hypothetical protein [unclassified Streptomyces]MBD0711605.1 hypothetical protein [Streptomyces sp. CBMA291]MBD0714802.1 hypothetical protein [Streptomyces sp. CBMA370]